MAVTSLYLDWNDVTSVMMATPTPTPSRADLFELPPWLDNVLQPELMIYLLLASLTSTFLAVFVYEMYELVVWMKWGPKPHYCKTHYVVGNYDCFKRRLGLKWERDQALDTVRQMWDGLRPQRAHLANRLSDGKFQQAEMTADCGQREYYTQWVMRRRTWYIFRPKVTPWNVEWVYSWPECTAARVVHPKLLC